MALAYPNSYFAVGYGRIWIIRRVRRENSKLGLHIFNCQDNLKQLELTAPTGNKE